MNGYFQIFPHNSMCCIKLIPPTDGGDPVNRDDLFEYLSIKNISYDMKALADKVSTLEKTAYFPTYTEFKYKDGEFVKIIISPDNMTVTVRMYPPFEGGELMPKDEFMREFKNRGVVYGFDDAAIDKFLKDRPYGTDTVLARGLDVVQGTDARIEYFFNTDPHAKPTLKEDGSVDFFNLNTINHCMKGDVLARLYPETSGTPGQNVKGELIKPRDVKREVLKYGHNIECKDDELVSLVSGHVSYVEGKVFVSNVFEIENVDTSVGNIDYDGSICINGNVCENFTVKAKGSIEVRGVVEGAYLEAGENITIARGMNGMHKGVLKAGGNIVAKFIENATITAGGFVTSESILHSTVIAGTEIKVVGKRGFISGGRVSATNSIEVRNLGSNMGADTIVEVGMDAGAKANIQELQKAKTTVIKQLSTIKPVLEGAMEKLHKGIKLSGDQLTQLQKLAVLNKDLSGKLADIENDLKGLLEKFDKDAPTTGQVIVTGVVYPGTKICIGDVSQVVKSELKYCRFIKEAGDVKMVAIY